MSERVTQSHNGIAAIYCRISSDKTGAGVGVEHQEADCRELADRMGVTVGHVLVDNDISAYSGKPRPGYIRLLELMKQGEIDYVLSWHTDRLHRSMVELEDYVTASEAGSVTTHTAKAGPIDLATPSGRLVARQLGAVARYEVEHGMERMQTAKLRDAKAGKFLGGQRPYGFEPQRKAIRESEAAVVREMAQRLIDGESYNSITIDLNRRGSTTKHGKAWRAINVENILARHINAGIVYHKGVEYPANTPAIFTPDEWADLQAAMERRRRVANHPGRFRKYLLNGLLYCGICGHKLYHRRKKNRDGSYRTSAACGITNSATGEQEGCWGVSRMVEPIEDLISDAVIYRLDSPQLVKQLQRRKKGNDELRQLIERQRRLEERLTKLNDDYYIHEVLPRNEFERLKLTTSHELAELEKQLRKTATSTVLPNISLSGDIRTTWDEATLAWQRDLLFQVIGKIIVHPKPRTEGYYPPRYKDKWWFDPELIEIKWLV